MAVGRRRKRWRTQTGEKVMVRKVDQASVTPAAEARVTSEPAPTIPHTPAPVATPAPAPLVDTPEPASPAAPVAPARKPETPDVTATQPRPAAAPVEAKAPSPAPPESLADQAAENLRATPQAEIPSPPAPASTIETAAQPAPAPPSTAKVESAPAIPADADTDEKGPNWLGKLTKGLSRSSAKIGGGLADLFTKTRLDDDTLEELEDLLIMSDLGVETSNDICEALRADRFNKDVSADEVKGFLADKITEILEPLTTPLSVNVANRPHVVLVVGVNGAGKTTTIAKLVKTFRDQGKSAVLAAGDTFRAAAVEQLQVWGDRLGCPVITTKVGGDPAGLAFEAIKQAQGSGADVVVIDTAGRLQNKEGLMAELAKIRRVIDKCMPGAPHDVVLVLDATTGQNALLQIEVFKDVAGVTGLIMTKLDGTARGGVLVAAARRFGLPIHAVGIGENMNDMRPFDAGQFARALVGVEATDTGAESQA